MIKLPFGVRHQSLVHISEVPSGAACMCMCPGCAAPLVAKKGTEVDHHFAHANGADCERGIESALHRAAKEAIQRSKEFRVQATEVAFDSYKKPWELAESRIYPINGVRLEMKMGTIIPDIVLSIQSHQLLLEVKVTHAVDHHKLQRIQALGISAIEIDLTDVSSATTIAAVAEAVVHGIDNKRWLFNAPAERVALAVRQTADRKAHIQRGFATHVDDCPIGVRVGGGKRYANVMDDCLECEFCVDSGLRSSASNELLCLGRRRLATLEDWQRHVQASRRVLPNES